MTSAPTTSETFTIGQVAARTGLSVHALRFYEQQDLLIEPVQRTTGGTRTYTSVNMDWLEICVKLRETGMPLADLKTFAHLVRQGQGNEEQRLQLLDTHRQRVEAQIAALEQCRSVIAWKVDLYTHHLQTGDPNAVCGPTRNY